MESGLAHAAKLTEKPWNTMQSLERVKWWELIQRCVKESWGLSEKSEAPDLFRVFAILGTRYFSNQRAADSLISGGRYGETAAIIRMILETADVLTYLALYPDQITRWRAVFSPRPDSQNKDLWKGMREFAPAKIRQQITAAGGQPVRQDVYNELSAAIHPSEWGAILYSHWSPDQPNQLNLGFHPIFNDTHVFRLNTLLHLSLAGVVWAFLAMCEGSNAKKSAWRMIKANYDDMLPEWEIRRDFDNDWLRMMEESESRVATGEDAEGVIQELVAEFKRRQGIEDEEENATSPI